MQKILLGVLSFVFMMWGCSSGEADLTGDSSAEGPTGQGGQTGASSGQGGSSSGSSSSSSGVPVPAGPAPILFVGQVPIYGFAKVSSTFGNHLSAVDAAPRGGDLYLREVTGALRNLTKEAGFGMTGLQGESSIAVREPAVHWDGTKAIFSMVIGTPTKQYQVVNTYRWQLYEVEGLAPGQIAKITKVPGQPEGFNNVSPCYGTDDRILFTSDRPRDGAAHHYPTLDEYESSQIVTGLYSLDPQTADLKLLTHAPSGLFSPIIDSYGRVLFTNWDHLQRDQQADADKKGTGMFGSFDFADESAGAAHLARSEMFPEPREPLDPDLAPNESKHLFNEFFPWMMNEDGSEAETLNHIGRQELGGTYSDPSFTDDPNLSYFTPDNLHLNQFKIASDGGLFRLREDPTHPGRYYASNVREFGTSSGGGIVRLDAPPGLDADKIVVTPITAKITRDFTPEGQAPDPLSSGHYRSVLPLHDGTVIAAHTAETRLDANDGTLTAPAYRYQFRLVTLKPSGDLWVAGAPLTGGIQRTVSYWDPGHFVSWTGALWELDPVEVVPRARPTAQVPDLEAPEAQIFASEGVSEDTLRAWLSSHDLALIVSRNVTTRDRGDRQQPFNLRVPGGVQTVGKAGKVYDVSFLQLFQGDQVRGYAAKAGRRVLARHMHDDGGKNPPVAGAPPGSVAIGEDGSMAAFVPSRRAMSWQLTAPNGKPVVRERNWVSFAPGEIRVCASCHGVNTEDQAGSPPPINPPEALRSLLKVWKTYGP